MIFMKWAKILEKKRFIPLRHDLPVLLFHDVDPQWLPDDIDEAWDCINQLSSAMQELGHPLINVCLQDTELRPILQPFNPDDHLVFNWCEDIPGISHSSYLVAQALEELGFSFTGADSQTLKSNQDKRLMKQMLHSRGIPTPRWQVYETVEYISWNLFPAIVKPALEHCSVGITRESVVLTIAELINRVSYILDQFRQPALVEEFIDGREFHVSVIGNGELQMLPPVEMDFSGIEDIHDRVCTYDAKFNTESLIYHKIGLLLNTPLTLEEYTTMEATNLAAYEAIGCRDFGRMDIRMKDGICYVLDANANPDLTPGNSVALAAEAAGLSYGELGSYLINLASQRHWIFN